MLCKVWGFHGGDYEECRPLGYENPVRASQETHYFSDTMPSRLMLCKIWGFHGYDYEECRLLGYENPVPISQETHYFSATELSRLMLCKIWGFHGGDYEECRGLGYDAVWVLTGARAVAQAGGRQILTADPAALLWDPWWMQRHGWRSPSELPIFRALHYCSTLIHHCPLRYTAVINSRHEAYQIRGL
jgi:hypothetical protein